MVSLTRSMMQKVDNDHVVGASERNRTRRHLHLSQSRLVTVHTATIYDFVSASLSDLFSFSVNAHLKAESTLILSVVSPANVPWFCSQNIETQSLAFTPGPVFMKSSMVRAALSMLDCCS